MTYTYYAQLCLLAGMYLTFCIALDDTVTMKRTEVQNPRRNMSLKCNINTNSEKWCSVHCCKLHWVVVIITAARI